MHQGVPYLQGMPLYLQSLLRRRQGLLLVPQQKRPRETPVDLISFPAVPSCSAGRSAKS